MLLLNKCMKLRLKLFVLPGLCQLLILPIIERLIPTQQGTNIHKSYKLSLWKENYLLRFHSTGSNSEARILLLHWSAYE